MGRPQRKKVLVNPGVPEPSLDSETKRREKGVPRHQDVTTTSPRPGTKRSQAQRSTEWDVPLLMPDLRVNDRLRGLSGLTILHLLVLVRQDYELRRRRSKNTAEYPMRHIKRILGNHAAEEVTEQILNGYVIQRRSEATPHGRPVSDASIKAELSMLHRGYVVAWKQRLIPRSAIPSFPTIPQDKLTVRQGVLRLEEVRAICALMDGDVADLVEFLFYSAWRVGEARRLIWEWVDLPGNEIHLPLDKAGRARSLPIAGEIESVIDRRLRRERGPYVFHLANGNPVGDFRAQWTRACEKANVRTINGRLPIVHDLRRSAIKRMVEAGIDRKTAMAFSGHVTESTFARYHIVDLGRMTAAANLLAGKQPPTKVGTLVTLPQRRRG
jgi:integrase